MGSEVTGPIGRFAFTMTSFWEIAPYHDNIPDTAGKDMEADRDHTPDKVTVYAFDTRKWIVKKEGQQEGRKAEDEAIAFFFDGSFAKAPASNTFVGQIQGEGLRASISAWSQGECGVSINSPRSKRVHQQNAGQTGVQNKNEVGYDRGFVNFQASGNVGGFGGLTHWVCSLGFEPKCVRRGFRRAWSPGNHVTRSTTRGHGLAGVRHALAVVAARLLLWLEIFTLKGSFQNLDTKWAP